METSYSKMVRDDPERGLFAVNRRAFTDIGVYEAERNAIFDRCWLYVGHESEVPTLGSYVTRKVAGRPLIMVRTAADEIKVLLNACPHRGNVVCRERSGTATGFTCFYHAWSFSLNGELKRIPFDDAYSAELDRSQLGLKAPAHVTNYRGLIFVNFDADAMPFTDYLGNARESLDCVLDYSEGRQIVEGAQRYSMRANWKLLVENSIDTYHALVVHQRYLSRYMGLSTAEQMKLMNAEGGGRGRQFDNGHAVMETPVFRTPVASQAETLALHRASLVERHGETRTARIADVTRNLFLFPNFIFISNWHTVRTFYPASPDYMEVDSWGLMPGGESEQMRKARVDNFISFLGPAGFGTPDDVEALEGCQSGYAADPDAWSDISRGMRREEPLASDELQMRAFWRHWSNLMHRYAEGDGSPWPRQAVSRS